MTARLAAGLLVSALIRRAEASGGGGMVLARGDATAGAILLVTAHRGCTTGLYERTIGSSGLYGWTPTGPAIEDDPSALSAYLDRRRRADPDQWVVEIDHPDALALASSMIAG